LRSPDFDFRKRFGLDADELLEPDQFQQRGSVAFTEPFKLFAIEV